MTCQGKDCTRPADRRLWDGDDAPWLCDECMEQGTHRLLRAIFGTDMYGEVVH